MSAERAWKELLDAACARYRPAGRFAWHFARGKLGGDPAFRHFLERGLIAPGARVLDLGSGQGLLASLLCAVDDLHNAAMWPAIWAPAPVGAQVHGIELMEADVRRASAALGAGARFTHGDIRQVTLEPVDVVVILDVLHYMDFADQRRVLESVRAALIPAGMLLLRVGDGAGGLPFRFSNWVDQVVTVRGHGWVDLHCRELVQWRALLVELGFDCEATPLSQGTPFANVLLTCRLRREGLRS